MKLLTITKPIALAAILFSSVSALAYDDEKEKEKCKIPKIQEFTLPVYEAPDNKEVPPETEFSFVVSGWANPKKITLGNGKGVDIPFTVDSKETFHKVKAKLPPELTGKYVRINARIPAMLECYSTVGWLIKVADKPKTAEAPQPQEPPAPETSNTPLSVPEGQAAAANPTPAKPENTAPVPQTAPAAAEKPATAP